MNIILLLRDWFTLCEEENIIMSRKMKNASTCTEVFVVEFRSSAKADELFKTNYKIEIIVFICKS